MNLNAYSSIVEGLVIASIFEGRPARVRHDIVSRTEDLNLKMTNEMFPYRPEENGSVSKFSKITFKLAKRPEWVDRFRCMLGEFVLDLFSTPGYGWMDTNNTPLEYKFNLMQCGGNLVNVLEQDYEHAYVETQDFNRPPNPDLTYRNAPHLTIKQVLVGRSASQKIYWITDKKRGDVTLPAVSPVRAAIPVEQLEFFPELPWMTKLVGKDIPVRISGYWFVGSNTYGLIDGNWLLLEEMQITGNGSHLDRKVYIENWVETCPPPVIGWTKGLDK